MKLNSRNFSAFLALVFVSTAANAALTAPPVQIVRTFDGQNMKCNEAADIGRIAYRKTGESGVIQGGKVDIKIDFETLKCVEQAGAISFQKSGLAGKVVNRLQGFTEVTALDLVAYTPDLKVREIQPVDASVGDHSVTFSVDVSQFPGLLARNIKANGEHTVVVATFLRGLINMGDARTGIVQQRDYVGFGSYMITLAEKSGTLKFANQPRSFPTP